MSNLDEDIIANLSKLSKIACSKAERQELVKDLKHILDYVEQLQEVDTEGVLPCCYVLANHKHLMRDDTVGELLPRDTFIANTPDHIGGMTKVPIILKKLS